MNTLKQKLNRVNVILAKLRYYVSADILKTIYHALFDSPIKYACQIWGQSHSKTFNMKPSEPLYQKLKINKLKNNNILKNCLLVFNNLPDVFDQFIQPLKSSITTAPGGHNNIYLIFQKQIHKYLVPIQ